MAAGAPDADALREAAQHRGYKLVKSRRRKPGTGDYGKFGLTDMAGKPLLGVSESGLTATAAEIEDYIRSSAAGSWQQSADGTPDRPRPKRVAPPAADDKPEESAKTVVAVRRSRSAAKPARSPTSARSPQEAEDQPPDKRASAKPVARPEPVAEPTLAIRKAKPSDAAKLAILISQLRGVTVSEKDIADDLKTAMAGQGGVLVAEFGQPVGSCAWRTVPTLHRGLIGRITLLVVDKDHRRRGIGTKLLEGAVASLGKLGCSIIEAMSDIDIVNAHNFFRSTGFAQASYRFTRDE